MDYAPHPGKNDGYAPARITRIHKICNIFYKVFPFLVSV